jgi:hypothetical protein
VHGIGGRAGQTFVCNFEYKNGFRFKHEQPALSELAIHGSRDGFRLTLKVISPENALNCFSEAGIFTVANLKEGMRKVRSIGEPFNMQTIVRTLETLSERLL